jgi:hypothetical protein
MMDSEPEGVTRLRGLFWNSRIVCIVRLSIQGYEDSRRGGSPNRRIPGSCESAGDSLQM